MPKPKRTHAAPRRWPAEGRARGRSRRGRSLWIVASLAGVLVASLAGALVLTRHKAPEPRSSPTAAYSPLVNVPAPISPAVSPQVPTGGRPPRTFTYVEIGSGGTWVRRLDLATGGIQDLFLAPSNNVSLAPTGDHAAYVMVRLKGGKEVSPGPGVTGTPLVHVVDLASGQDTVVGEGSGPTWSYDGSRLAAYRSVDPSGQITEVVAMSIGRGGLTPITPPGYWSIVGWGGDRLLVYRKPPFRLFFLSLDGRLQEAPTPDATVQSVSPDGRWVFAASRLGGAVFQPLSGGRPAVIDLGPWQLGATYWTGNDLLFAAAATGTDVSAPSTILVLDPSRGTMLELPGTGRAVATIPSPDGRSLALIRGKFPPDWHVWGCSTGGSCRKGGDVRIGIAPAQLG